MEAAHETLTDKPKTTKITAYKLIHGYSYIHGLADGEGLGIPLKRGIKPEKICLV
jgi:hypothetical protein